MEKLITLDKSNIDQEHICCAFSDKKCSESYQLKKSWLKKEFDNDYTFLRINARAKVFIEYGPAEKAWTPVHAPNYLMINCFWVSGQYKQKGYGKALLQKVWEDGVANGKSGLVTVAGIKKYHFMSDTKWLIRQGFEVTEENPDGFIILTKKIDPSAQDPVFVKNAMNQTISPKGLVAYFSNRCPYAEFHVKTSLVETAAKRNIPLKTIKFETLEEAQSSPTPATIFSLFYNGKFITTDISTCMDTRFDKIMQKHIS